MTAKNETIIATSGITKRFEKIVALENVSLDVPAGATGSPAAAAPAAVTGVRQVELVGLALALAAARREDERSQTGAEENRKQRRSSQDRTSAATSPLGGCCAARFIA